MTRIGKESTIVRGDSPKLGREKLRLELEGGEKRREELLLRNSVLK